MSDTPSLQDKYVAHEGRLFMTGTQALVRLPLVQHRADLRRKLRTATFITGYQGSPLGTYDLELGRQSKALEEHDVVFQPGLNEEMAATAVMGTQLLKEIGSQRYDGVLGIWYGKSPGLDRASDALRHANLIGTARLGGALAIVGDDPTAKSSSAPSTSDAALYDLGIPFFVPGDVQEVLDYGLHAVALSRSSGLWAGLKLVTNVADGSQTVAVDEDRVRPETAEFNDGVHPFEHEPTAMLIGSRLQALEQTLRYARIEAAQRYVTVNGLNRITVQGSRDSVGIVAPGKSYFDLLSALERIGLTEEELSAAGIRLLKIGVPFPLDPDLVRRFADGLSQVIVVEEKRAFVETFIKDALYGMPNAPAVVGKRDETGAPLFRANGELGRDDIARSLASRMPDLVRSPPPPERERLTLHASAGSPAPTIARTPYFCSGCPHNSSVKVPEGSLVGAGIGCSGLVMLMNEKQVGTVAGLTQMGGEGAQWIGMAPFTEVRHIFQNIGDGTFHHSGSLAVRAAVAANVNITYKLLYNSAVAMTGGQKPVGGMDVPAIVNLLLTEGVQKVVVTTDDLGRYSAIRLPRGVEVLDRSQLVEAEARLAVVPGVTVLLHDQECAAQKRRKRKRGKLEDPTKRIFINERACEGCGDCGEKSNCLSVVPVSTEFGRKTQIDQASCNRDYSCLDGDCPSFLEVIPAARPGRDAPTVEPTHDALPDPPPISCESYAVRITGIGGTGILTVAQILGMAASIDGWFVRALDQTGMAQKGGPVVSDVRLSTTPNERANKLATADCDLYIGADLLGATDPSNLAVIDPLRTVTVLSPTAAPTGEMVVDAKLGAIDVSSLIRRIERLTDADKLHIVDVQALTQLFLGAPETSNIALLGVAYQAGGIPLSVEAIESAIRLNGAGVAANLEAFYRGREAVCHPERLAAAVAERQPTSRPSDRIPVKAAQAQVRKVKTGGGSPLRRLLELRVGELIGYQNERYAARYVAQVERVREAEALLVPDGGEILAEAVARNLYKLMAYKDEAEIARLSLDPELRRQIEAQFGEGARYAWKLHPPAFRAMGLQKKITVGRWFTPMYHLLYASRHLRGTRVNPFGYTKLRRLERDLIGEYIAVLEVICERLTPENHGTSVTIAELPDMIRGYEGVKMRNVELYHGRLAELLAVQPGQKMTAKIPA